MPMPRRHAGRTAAPEHHIILASSSGGGAGGGNWLGDIEFTGSDCDGGSIMSYKISISPLAQQPPRTVGTAPAAVHEPRRQMVLLSLHALRQQIGCRASSSDAASLHQSHDQSQLCCHLKLQRWCAPLRQWLWQRLCWTSQHSSSSSSSTCQQSQ